MNHHATIAIAFVALLITAGCLGGALSSEEPISAAEPNNDDTMTAGELRWNLENPPEEDGLIIDVEKFAVSDDTLILRYETGDDTDPLDEIGVISGVYAGYVDENESPVSELRLVILDEFGEPVGEFRIEADWANRYNNGKVERTEYLSQILQTGSLE